MIEMLKQTLIKLHTYNVSLETSRVQQYMRRPRVLASTSQLVVRFGIILHVKSEAL